MPSPLQIRSAAPSELDVVLSVDDDASRRYPSAGVVIDLAVTHPFIVAERARWGASLARGDVFLAERDGGAVGVAVLGTVDGAPYLDQLSVRMDAMGQGVGGELLARAKSWAAARSRRGLFLTTYGHLAWNVPFYRRRGLSLVREANWAPEIRGVIESQRACLPAPDQRVVMWAPPAE